MSSSRTLPQLAVDVHGVTDRATRFSLDRLKRILPPEVMSEARAYVWSMFATIASLVARQRYDELTVRALLRFVAENDAAKRSMLRAHDLVASVRWLEREFLDSDREAAGLERIGRLTAANIARSSRLEHRSPPSPEPSIQRVVEELFGDLAVPEPWTPLEWAAAFHVRLGPLLSGQLDGYQYLFERHVVPALAVRQPDPTTELPVGAPLLRQWEEQTVVAQEGAPIFRARYRVEGTEGPLAEDEEVHIAPGGCSQVEQQVYTHLRHRWYPAATAVVIRSVEAADWAGDVRRHHWIKCTIDGDEHLFPKYHRDVEEAFQQVRMRHPKATGFQTVEQHVRLFPRRQYPTCFLDDFRV